MNITEILRNRAAAQPQAAAIIDAYRSRQRVTTFAELELASARAATLLWRAGLRPGDTVLVFQPMSAELYVALSAIFRLGLIAMFLDPGHGQNYIEICCSLHEPKALIASAKAHLLRFVSPTLRRIPHKFVIGPSLPGAVSWLKAGYLPSHPDIWPCSTETPALITFTSGSTGQPKAACRSHGFLLAQHRVLAQTLRLTAGDLDLTTMPIVALANLASGVTCLIPKADLRYPGAIDPAPVVAQLQTYDVDSAVASPALLSRLAGYCLKRHLILPALRKVFTGGGPVWPRLLNQMQQIAPNAEIVGVYGSTEAEPIATLVQRDLQTIDSQAMLAGQGLLVGRPVGAVNLRIIPDRWGTPLGPYTEAAFAASACSPGEIGEIVVSGAHVLPGYLYGHGNETTKIKVAGTIWHRTGDAGYLDATGRLWLLGRCAARIEDRHGILYPFAVECAVHQHPGVQRAAVVAYQGQRVLVVEPDDPALSFKHKPLGVQSALWTPKIYTDLTESLKKALVWAHIDRIRLCHKIPVDQRHNAKVDYPALYQLLKKDRSRSKNFHRPL